MEFRILGPLEVADQRARACNRSEQAAGAAGDPAAPRERGRLERPFDRGAVGRAAAGQRREEPAGARLAAAQALEGGRERRGKRRSSRVAAAIWSASSRASSTWRASSGCVEEGSGALAERGPSGRWSCCARRSAVARSAARRVRLRAVRAARDRPAGGAPSRPRIEQRIEAELALGRHAQLIARARVARRTAPVSRATAQCSSMLALYRAGRQAEALEAYRARAPDARRGARHRARQASSRSYSGRSSPTNLRSTDRGSAPHISPRGGMTPSHQSLRPAV